MTTYTVALIPDDGGGYTLVVPALPGCVTEGDTLAEALQMAEDAIAGYLSVLVEDGDPLPVEGPEVSVGLGQSPELIMRRAVFVERRSTGGHRILRHPVTRRLVSVPSHPGDLRTGTVASIVRQSGLTAERFVDLLR